MDFGNILDSIASQAQTMFALEKVKYFYGVRIPERSRYDCDKYQIAALENEIAVQRQNTAGMNEIVSAKTFLVNRCEIEGISKTTLKKNLPKGNDYIIRVEQRETSVLEQWYQISGDLPFFCVGPTSSMYKLTTFLDKEDIKPAGRRENERDETK